MTDKETIQFLFKFATEYTTTPPTVEIVNNGVTVLPVTEIFDNQEIELHIDLYSNIKDYVLEINRGNHDGAAPQMLSLVSVQTDGIDLKRVLNHTKFYPEYPLVWYNEQLAQGIQWPESHQGWLGWGWNGTWKMVYHTPFYDWLLKEV